MLGPSAAAERLDAAALRSLLICRINARMGNALFLTPLVRRVRELLPLATIDIASAYPQAPEMFRGFPGVRRVIPFPYKGGVQLAARYVGALRQVRLEPYDLAIDPVPDSTSDRIVMLAARARYRLGFASASQWLPLTHAVPLPETTLHQAGQPVYLLDRALAAASSPRAVRLELCLGLEEIAAGRARVEQAMGARGLAPTVERACGFFAHATGLKGIAQGYWREFWEAFLALEPSAVPVEVLPAPDCAPTRPAGAALHCASPRGLAAAMASMRMFISGDTGPMHLASSTSVPTVGLFHASDPALYGPLKPSDLVLDPTRCAPVELAQRCQEVWARRSAAGSA